MTLVFIAAVLLLVGAGLALLPIRNETRALIALATQGIASGLVLIRVVPVMFGAPSLRGEVAWAYPIGAIDTSIDAVSAFFLAWSLPMTWLGTLYARGYLASQFRSRHAGVQFGLLNVTSLAFAMIYSFANATAFLLGWEIAAVAAWLLVIWEYGNQKIRFAGFNYLVSTHVGFFFLVAAFMVMHSQTHSMTFGSFGVFLRTPGPMRNLTFLLLVAAFGLKSAFFPFHTWLPRAHSAAPAHVSALMSGVIHKAGLFALLRFTLLMGEPEQWMGWFLLSFSAISAFVGVLYTSSQRDLKRLLGYSSTENVGIVGVGFGLGYLGLSWHQPALVVLGFGGGLLHVLNHAVFKCLLFYAAGAVYRATHTVDLERLGGLGRAMPWTARLFLVGSVAISGLPPLNGFVSELLIYTGLLGGKAPGATEQLFLICAAALLAFVGGVSALSMTRSFGLAFLGVPRDPSVHAPHEVGWAMRATMIVHALFAVLIGVFPGAAFAVVAAPVARFTALLTTPTETSLAAEGHAVVGLTSLGWAAALVLVVLAGLRRALMRGAPAPRHVTWGCGYTAPNARMQTTGTAFSSQFTEIFAGVFHERRRATLPEGAFPEKGSHIGTHHVDAIEHRLFEALGEGEGIASRVSAKISEEPRFAFALGLIALGLLAGAVLLGGSR